MINILFLTIITLVVIAVGVQLCKPKDHGKGPLSLFRIEHDGTKTPLVTYEDPKEVEIKRIMATYKIPAELFNDQSRADYSNLNEKRKQIIDDLVPPDLKKAYDTAWSSEESFNANRIIMLNHLQDEFNHKPKL